MTAFNRQFAAALAAGFLLCPPGSRAHEDVSTGQQPPGALQDNVRVLQQKQVPPTESPSESPKQAPSGATNKDGFLIKSADGALALRLGAVVQADSRWYLDAPAGSATDDFLIRKARPIFELLIEEKFLLRIMPDYGNGQTVLQEAYVEARLDSAFNVRTGKFKSPIGLERLQLDSENEFIERALPTNLAPNRDVGLQLSGSVLSNTVSYQVGVFDGVYDNGLADGDSDNSKDGAGRIFLEPFRNGSGAWKGLGVGISASAGRHHGTVTHPELPQFRTMGQQKFFSYLAGAYADGVQDRVSPQFFYYYGPWGVLGEYIVSRQAISRATNQKRDIDNRAWQLAGYWVITGEDASYHGVRTPRARFAPAAGAWGALELVARYSVQTNDNDAYIGSAASQLANPTQSAHQARERAIGLNWYLDRNLKVQINYEETRFTGGSSGSDRVPEKLILTRFQIAV